jgi:hypothetical protein
MSDALGKFIIQKRELRDAVGEFLKEFVDRRDYTLAQVGHMAGSPSFSFNQSLKWVRSEVRLASDLPFLSDLKDEETGEIVIDEGNIDLIRQRPVDWSRQAELARYLVAEPLHQFPPLLLVITSAWAEDPDHPNWVNGRASMSTFECEGFGSFDAIVDLSLDPDKYSIYALDGQHRVIGIRGALEMVDSGSLQPKDRSGKAKGNPIMLDEWLGDERTRADVNLVPNETIGIQLIPAVLEGETIEEARRRIATVFVHVNQTAAPLKDGELTLIDRNDGFADVAKFLATKHPFFARTRRVNLQNNTISKRSTHVTTLSTLKTCARLFLREDHHYDAWFTKRGRGKTVAHRPPEAELEAARNTMGDIWSRITALPCFVRLNADPPTPVPTMRNVAADGGEAHLLFRPIGQQVLLQAIGMLLFDPDVRMSRDQIFEILARYDTAGGFAIDNPEHPWYNVIYNPSMGKMVVSGQALSARLLAYMVGGGLRDREARELLQGDFAEARKSREGYAWNLEGVEVPIDEITLPDIL